MKPKVATITALVIGTLVVAAGIFPATRGLALSILRGERTLRDLAFWSMGNGGHAAENGGAHAPTEEGKTAQVEAPGTAGGAGGAELFVADPQADALLAKSIAMLDRCSSIVAKTRQSVEMHGKHLAGSGEYIERRAKPIPMFRMELKVQVGSEPKTLLHVCNGRYFWRCETYKGKGTAERIDLARVIQAREGREDVPLPAFNQWPGLGGLPRLLQELRGAFQFSTPYPTQLRDQDRTAVTAILGIWKPERLAVLMPDRRSLPKSAQKFGPHGLPEHLPYCVIVYLGRDDLFPFRIEYHSRPVRTSPTQGTEEDTPMVAMDFFEVALNVSVQEARFSFAPGNLESSDQTDRYLERLRLKHQQGRAGEGRAEGK